MEQQNEESPFDKRGVLLRTNEVRLHSLAIGRINPIRVLFFLLQCLKMFYLILDFLRITQKQNHNLLGSTIL